MDEDAHEVRPIETEQLLLVEKLANSVENIVVHGKFPDGVTVNGHKLHQPDPGGLVTIKASTGKSTPELIFPRWVLDDIYFEGWEREPKHQAVMLIDVGKSEASRLRVVCMGVQQPNFAINDSRARSHPSPVAFRFDVPTSLIKEFYRIFTEDRQNAPHKFENLLKLLYKDLFTTTENPDKGIIMKPLEQIVFVDETFSTGMRSFSQTNPNRVFPPPKL